MKKEKLKMAHHYIAKVVKGKEHAADIACFPGERPVKLLFVNSRYAAEMENMIQGDINIKDENGKIVDSASPLYDPYKWITNLHKADMGFGFKAEKAIKVTS